MSDAEVHRWNASDGVELAWREIGAGRPVILLHGLFSDAYVNWIKFGTAERVAQRGFRVIMPDLRAHGLSAKPHEPEHYPRGIRAGRARAGGSRWAWRIRPRRLLARRADDGRGGRGGSGAARAILGGAGLEGLRNWEQRKHFFLETIDLFDNVRRGDPHWLSIQFMKSQGTDRVAARLLLDSFEDAFMDWLHAFTMPTLVVCGTEDDDNGSAEELANVMPNARFEEVPGTHMSSVTRPEFGEAIANFVAG